LTEFEQKNDKEKMKKYFNVETTNQKTKKFENIN